MVTFLLQLEGGKKSPAKSGLFFCPERHIVAANPKKAFAKKAESAQELVARILDRGLVVPPADTSELYGILHTVGYYRFTGFCLPFQQKHKPNKGKFLANTTLRNVMGLYHFDSELRTLCGQALEKIEIYVRNIVCDHMSRTYGPHWYADKTCFQGKNFTELFQTAARNVSFDLQTQQPSLKSSNPHLFLQHYYTTYNPPAMPPSWMHRECSSFGYWARAYAELSTADQKAIASRFTFPNRKLIDPVLLENWFQSVSIFRNRCAHHTRITHRVFPFAPNAPKNNACQDAFGEMQSDLRTLILVLTIFMKCIAPTSPWRNSLRLLFDKSGDVSIEDATRVGLKYDGWENDPLWTI
jgi:abortive infection bacteriophage resistance protein